jgi:integrase
MPNRNSDWQYGWVHRSKTGRKTYYVREKRDGRLFEVSTGAHTEGGAHREYERFDKDPDAYVASARAGSLALTEELIEAYLNFCRLPEEPGGRGGKGNSARWIIEKGRCLDWWVEEIGSRDLRRLRLADLQKALESNGERVPGYAHRVEVVKDFYGWLREKRGFPAQQDPTTDLLVPQARPGTRQKKVKAFTRDTHERLVKHVTGPYRLVLVVLAGTVWHLTEALRFAKSGTIEPMPKHMNDPGSAGVLVCPMHKSGDEHRTPVTAEVLDAAERLRKYGGFSESRLYKAVRSGCAAADPPIDPIIDPGQYRHAVATWAIEAGEDPADVAKFLGHRSPATTKRFYARFAVPPRIPTLSR